MRFRFWKSDQPEFVRAPVSELNLLHCWEHEPRNRPLNGGVGLCNSASGKPLVCLLGGVGCDVDHHRIAAALRKFV